MQNTLKSTIFLLAAALLPLASCGPAGSPTAENTTECKTYLIRPHQEELEQELLDCKDAARIFLAGTIDMGVSRDWQSEMVARLQDSTRNLIFFSPRQEHWDASKPGEMDYQVNWELSHLEQADRIIMYIIATSKSPISLLEMGLHARSGKMEVICEPDFYRFDNVRITCQYYGVPLFTSLEEFYEKECRTSKATSKALSDAPSVATSPQTWAFPVEGDLVFVRGGESDFSEAIGESTGGGYVHVGIAAKVEGRLCIIEADDRQGVWAQSWEAFRTQYPALTIMRMKGDFPLQEAVSRAKSFIGQDYDWAYLPDNGRLYCSELVQLSYLDKAGQPIFPSRPMNFRAPDGSLPEFWEQLFRQQGQPVPQGVPGTNPNDLSRSPYLETVGSTGHGQTITGSQTVGSTECR